MRSLFASILLTLIACSASASTFNSHYGHYYATGGQDDNNADIKYLCGKKGITGINKRMNWNAIEVTEGVFTPSAYDTVLTNIATMTASTGTGGNYVANSACRVWLFLTIRGETLAPAHGASNPCPTWLRASDGSPGFAANARSLKSVNIASGASAVSSTGSGTITITTATAHGFANGDQIMIDLTRVATGNNAANGLWTIANVTSTTFTLTGSHGNGTRVQSGSPTGWQGKAVQGPVITCKIWDSTVRAKLNTLIAYLGATYDANANVEGLQFQESALGLNGAYIQDSTVGGNYSGTLLTAAMVEEIQKCGLAFPAHGRCMYFINQINGNQAGVYDVSAALSALPSNQGCYSGPDLLPNQANLWNSKNATYQAEIKHVGCRSNSAQNTTIVGSPPPTGKACGTTNCNNVFNFAVRGVFGETISNKPAPLVAPTGLCINSYIFWNHSQAGEEALVDPTVQGNPYGSGWYGQCSCGGATP